MIQILETEDKTLVKIADNRYDSSQNLWEEIGKTYKKYLNVWKNLPDWIDDVPTKKSHVRDNRQFLVMESVVNKVTAKPTKPNIIPANETPEAKEVSADLQDYFLEMYDELGIKKTLKRALRYVFICKLACLKVYWNPETDYFGVKPMDPRKVRFSRGSTNEETSEFSIEDIKEPIITVLETFPEKEEQIIKLCGTTKEAALTNNQEVEYREMWIGDGVCWIMKNEVIAKRQNPYFDFNGLKLTKKEKKGLLSLNGKRRRTRMTNLKLNQVGRGLEGDQEKYEQYKYNYFTKARKPYIFGTILELEDKPTGETSLLEQTNPLQVGIDKRKRQIDDNCDFVNGVVVVDTNIATITLVDAKKIQYDPQGVIYGPGVSTGVKREYGQSLPAMVFDDMGHSIMEIDAIWGATDTYRGEGSKAETATGRAILREEAASRQEELVALVDYLSGEIYKWQFQMIKLRFTENRMRKCIGAERTGKVLELIQDDYQDGIDIKIIPGQVLPDDKIFRAERASEDFRAGFLDPVTYFETVGGYDNPQEIAKRYVMYKQNPFSVIDMTDEDIQKLQQAAQILQATMPQPPQPPGENPEEEARGEEMAQMKERVQELMGSEEFQKLPDEKKLVAIRKIKASIAGGKKVGLPT